MAKNRGVVYMGPGKVEVQSIDFPKLELTSRKFCYHLQCSESARKLYRDGSWWPAPKARVRSLRIVMISPSFDNDFSFK
jgi:hypothetical protein